MDYNSIRFQEDNPNNLIKVSNQEDVNNYRDKVKYSLYSNAVLITDCIFPELYESIQSVKKTLVIDYDFESFVKPNPIPQAYCISSPINNTFSLVITSSIITLLTLSELKFVIGHEIGHFLFKHTRYPNPDNARNEIEYLKLTHFSRCAEISADRIGFVASPSIDDAFRGMLKVASGLPDEFIKLNVSEYINQLKKIKSLNYNDEHAYSTHPVFPFRMRALLWFSMSSQYYNAIQSSNVAPLDGNTLEKNVTNDLYELSGKLLYSKEKEIIQYISLWATMFLAAEDSKISKEEQSLLKKQFGDKLIAKSLSFLKDNYAQNIQDIILKKLINASTHAYAIREEILDVFFNDLFKLKETFNCKDSTLDKIHRVILNSSNNDT